jgi:cobalamin biosynthesis Mg chelatase CobN
MTLGRSTRPATLLTLAVALTLLLVGCGSGASGTVAQQAKQAVSTATSQIAVKLTETSGTKTAAGSADATATSKAVTVTQPAQSHTVTATTTESKPDKITSINNRTTAVKVAPTSTAATTEDSGGVPWWGWVLIALGVVVIGIAIYALGRHHGSGSSSAPPAGRVEGS